MENENKFIKFLKWFFHSFIWIGILLFIVDIVSKNIIVSVFADKGGEAFDPKDGIEVIPHFLWFNYAINRNAAFGFGPKDPNVARILYICFASIATIGLSIWFAKGHKKMPGYVRAAIGLIIAGALGNMVDRIFYTPEYLNANPGTAGGVVDFIDFFYDSPLHNIWGYIFNIADCCVVIGTFMLIIWMLIDWIKDIKKDREEKAKEPKDTEKVLSASERKKIQEQEENKVE